MSLQGMVTKEEDQENRVFECWWFIYNCTKNNKI